MNQPILAQIEDSFTKLSVSEQRRLIERLVHRVQEIEREFAEPRGF